MIERHIFTVLYVPRSDLRDPKPVEFRVEVTLGDKLDVETEGHRYGLLDPPAQPQLVGALWLYYAARREGHIPAETPWSEFRARCLGNQLVKSDPVPPTVQGASDEPLSTSPLASPEPASTSGSTPPAPTNV